MKLSSMRTADQVVQEHRRKDPEFRAEWDRAAFAREVAIAVIRYRAEHGMSQRGLAHVTGLAQPAIARLEKADHQPSLDTLAKLSIGTGIAFRVEVIKGAVGLSRLPTPRTSKSTPSTAPAAPKFSSSLPHVASGRAARAASVPRSAPKTGKVKKDSTAGKAKTKKTPQVRSSR